MAKPINYAQMKKDAQQATAGYQAAILSGKPEETATPIEVMSEPEDDEIIEEEVPEDEVIEEPEIEDEGADEPEEVPQTETINNTPFLADASSTALEQFADAEDDGVGTFVDVPPEAVEMPDEDKEYDDEEETAEPEPSAFERPEAYVQSQPKAKLVEKPVKAQDDNSDDGKKEKATKGLSKYEYQPGNAREVPRELVRLAEAYFPSCQNQSLAVGAYILAHEGFPKNLVDTPDVFMEMARTFTGETMRGNSADTMEDLEDLKTEIGRLRSDNKNLMHKLETIELAVAFLLVQYNAAIPTNTQVDKLKFSGDKLDEVMRNLSSAAVNKSIKAKYDKGRPIS